MAGSLVLALLALPHVGDRAPSSPAAPRDGTQSSSLRTNEAGTGPATGRAGEAGGAPGASRTPAASLLRGTVLSVSDGDTVTVGFPDGSTERVRLIGVNSPELSHPDLGIRAEPFGGEAADYTRAALEGREVHLELDVQERDRYGRLLAYVWLAPPPRAGETAAEEVRTAMFNARLLRDGYAQVMTVPPNVRYADLFRRLQAEAREEGRGLWGARGGAPGRSTGAQVPPAAMAPPAQGRGDAAAGRAGCDPSYPDVCVPPPPPDLDCRDVPHRRFRVLPPDPHHFDGDGDGLGCEGR